MKLKRRQIDTRINFFNGQRKTPLLTGLFFQQTLLYATTNARCISGIPFPSLTDAPFPFPKSLNGRTGVRNVLNAPLSYECASVVNK